MYMWAAPSFGPPPQVRPPWGGKGGWVQPPPAWGGQGGGKGASAFCSKESYVESLPRPEDAEAYSSAGIMFYKKGESGVELLLSVERPWNSHANDYDPLAWNVLGGKRKTGPQGEWEAPVTAARWFMEVMGGAEGAPSTTDVEQMCRGGPVLWYPQGRFIMFIVQVDVENEAMQVYLDAAPRFLAAKEEGKYPFGPSEQRLNSKGQPTTRWVKQIEELEWVPASDLIAETETRKPLTDLCKNVTAVEHLRSFLLGGNLPPSVPVPPVDESSKPAGKPGKKGGYQGDKGGGKNFSKDGGKKGNSGKGKGGKGKGGGDWGKGKNVPYPVFAPMPAMPVNPQMYPAEMQRQMLGEKLYMTVQPLVPSATVAQKVTGMLLELPMPELMPLLGSGDNERAMLQTRVEEAMEVLEAEDLAGGN